MGGWGRGRERERGNKTPLMEIKREGQERENEGIIALPTNTSHALDGERRRLMGVKLNGSTSAKERGREEERRRAGEGRKCEHNRLNLHGYVLADVVTAQLQARK